jgi:diguanylate cyclase (GGDEF)-like protein
MIEVRQSQLQSLSQHEIERLVYVDPLSQLPNRRYVEESLPNLLQKLDGTALFCFVDIDCFKQANQISYAFGDSLLSAFSQRLASLLRSHDLVCRFGGDEFILILSGLSTVDAARQGLAICERLLTQMQEPYPIEGRLYSVTMSIGCCPIDTQSTFEGLMKRADDALRAAKRSGGNAVRMADALQPEVTRAQPDLFAAAMQVDSNQSCVGAEILLPAACVDLAQWFHYLERLRSHYAASFASGDTPFHLAIDLPQRLIGQDMALIQSFTQMLQAYVVNHALPAQTVCLEMDESFLQSSPMVLDHFYQAMNEAEIMLCLDHYGRPQSRFGSQCEPFFSLVKLSVNLCDQVCHDPCARSQIEGIVTLAKTMGQIPIAQNSTHDAATQLALAELGCEYFQGPFVRT